MGDKDFEVIEEELDTLSQRVCKICYGKEEEEIDIWMAPCKCSGSIKWVHKDCMTKWIDNAPFIQQNQCNTCRFPYKKCWSLKPMFKWSWPKLNLGCWDMIEIFLDMYSTFKLIRNTIQAVQGKKSVFGQMCYFFFWKTFIFSTARIEYYKGMAKKISLTVFEANIQDVE